MEFSIDKYRFCVTGNTVIAISSYAGKTVRGIAKCDPLDEFSFEEGKRLSAARCNEKIARKRLRRAKCRMGQAEITYLEAKKHYEDMQQYFTDAQVAYGKAQNYTMATLSQML